MERHNQNNINLIQNIPGEDPHDLEKHNYDDEIEELLEIP